MAGVRPGALALLAGLSTAMDLSFGALWVPERAALTAKGGLAPRRFSARDLGEVTRARHPGYGGPTLGRAWTSRQPVASNDPAVGKPPQRAAAILDARVEATMAIPAVAVDETLAVLEFFSA